MWIYCTFNLHCTVIFLEFWGKEIRVFKLSNYEGITAKYILHLLYNEFHSCFIVYVKDTCHILIHEPTIPFLCTKCKSSRVAFVTGETRCVENYATCNVGCVRCNKIQLLSLIWRHTNKWLGLWIMSHFLCVKDPFPNFLMSNCMYGVVYGGNVRIHYVLGFFLMWQSKEQKTVRVNWYKNFPRELQ